MRKTVSPASPPPPAASPGPAILIVDDEVQALQSFAIALRSAGIEPVVCEQDSRRALERLAEGDFGAILLDLMMPFLSGRELLPRILAERPQTPVIVVTGANDVETAVECMKAGAFEYLVKPIERARLLASVRNALEVHALRRENTLLRRHLLADGVERPEIFQEILTAGQSLRPIFQYAEAVAPTGQPVLITGETGSGKELMARAIHHASGRPGEFVAVNVAGLDETVFSDTLFGHRRGAFTGAEQARAGLIERASGGTLFLDEIGDLSLPNQVKLLRLLQEREYFPLGEDTPRRADARIIVATNQDPGELAREGRFRHDLYYRLLTHHIHLPPLRERKEDLPVLAERFLEEAARELGKRRPTAPPELIPLLSTYAFPGNIRELRSMIFDAVSRHRGGVLSLEVFRARILPQAPAPGEPPRDPRVIRPPSLQFSDFLPTLREAADLLTQEAMRRAGGNQSVAARMLGVTQQALSKRLKTARQRRERTEE